MTQKLTVLLDSQEPEDEEPEEPIKESPAAVDVAESEGPKETEVV